MNGMTRTFQICPVCMGRGMVHHGFYNTSPTFMSTSTNDEQCRRCMGLGTIATPVTDSIGETAGRTGFTDGSPSNDSTTVPIAPGAPQ